ncbi:MAG TPA: helix-turn-helix domain-containing protein [Pseudolabrys sp.]|nr:helix-turn-helix domain-containing protein [Pseudolabrys sp.]
MTYAMEFRRAVASAYDECGSSIEVAEQFECSESWVRRLIQRRRENGSLQPKPHHVPRNNKLNERDLSRLAELIAQQPDMTLAELAEALGNKVSVPTVHRATRRLGLPLKKSRCMPPSRTGPTSKRLARTGSNSSPRSSSKT